MGLTIADGKGTGNEAEVDFDNRLVVRAIVEKDLEYASDKNGLAYTWSSGTYDPDAGDTILSVKNTSTTRHIHIQNIWLSCDTETRVVIHLLSDNSIPAGTSITGTNLNMTSGNIAEATATRDDTGYATQGSILWSGEIQAATNPLMVAFDGAVILGTNDAIGVDYVSASTAADVVICGHFDTGD